MPEISRFYGIVIAMYYNDHDPPHFHVRYSGQKGVFRIDNSEMTEGNLPHRARRLAVEWAESHRAELVANWERARRTEPFASITPLE